MNTNKQMLEEAIVETTKLGEFCRQCELEILVGDKDDDITFKRVQVIGYAEYYYLATLQDDIKEKALTRLFNQKIPCIIYARGIKPTKMEIDIAKQYGIPVLLSDMTTTWLMQEISAYLDDLLAPIEVVHGSLLDINGVGVLLTGTSGMGKSETAIELINRGHRIIADDAVIVKKVRNDLVGRAPDKIKHFIEVRGLGIIDIKSMYGVSAVLDSETIDLVIHLDNDANLEDYDRLGSMDNTFEILGESRPQINVPVLAGRNLAVIVEVATRNYQLKIQGYDALEELRKRTNLI